MTSGYMNCPKCNMSFQYLVECEEGKWTKLEEPWECQKCNSLIVVDKEKGYGLKAIKRGNNAIKQD